MTAAPGDVTRLLAALRGGNREARSQLASLVYQELHQIAGRLMAHERPNHTLQATALVNDAYLKLVDQNRTWHNRAHFFAVASQVMRRILVDCARAHAASKRGGVRQQVELDEQMVSSDSYSEKILALDEALLRLSKWEPRQAQVVELRFFGGLSEEETASVLGVSSRTVKRDWSLARAWLHTIIGR